MSSERKTVLVLDDDPALLMIVKYALADLLGQISFHTCTRIHEGLRDLNPDVVVSDIHFPRISGEETVRVLRTFFPKIPMGIMSGVTPLQLPDLIATYRIEFISKDNLLGELGPFVSSLLAQSTT